MAFTPNVVDGNVILAQWGNEVRDRTSQVFATAAERDAQWAAPPNGATCITLDTATQWRRLAGAWTAVQPGTVVTSTTWGPLGNGKTWPESSWPPFPLSRRSPAAATSSRAMPPARWPQGPTS